MAVQKLGILHSVIGRFLALRDGREVQRQFAGAIQPISVTDSNPSPARGPAFRECVQAGWPHLSKSVDRAGLCAAKAITPASSIER